MFEITKDHIGTLNDTDLRTLIGLLCEAEMRRAKLPVAAVTWGGAQTAKDGGLDVRVALPNGTQIQGFIPRAGTGFQIKKHDMPPSAVEKEMNPDGTIRKVIEELAAESGAYVIVSASGSTSDSALNERRNAMAQTISALPNAKKLYLDFYDRNRVATWVRDHPGWIPWVREKIGAAIPGWHSYGNWSHAPSGVNQSYLVDDKARIKKASKNDGDGLTIVDGLNQIRTDLARPGSVIRLVGLSGVGKTRFLQALFEEKIGSNALDPSLAIYTDIAEEPNPPPKALTSQLQATGTRAIIVIDNCPPEIHRQLADIVRSAGRTVSLLTVEYDIRDDKPEGTDVYVLDSSSLPLIEKLVASRYPALSQVDTGTVARFSGGNARIALALASTIKDAETIAGLTNAELFTRLFQQRHSQDASLLLVAQACALVYSFNGDDPTGERAELSLLGRLIDKSASEMFRGVSELKRRDLLQQRGVWRAVLPHAVANRLAEVALQNIPYSSIEPLMFMESSERLLLSFSRRLGFLDGSPEAALIVRKWLSSGEPLYDVLNLGDMHCLMFRNIAPVAPGEILSLLEDALTNADRDSLVRNRRYIRLLRSLAYEPAFFRRAINLMLKYLILHENEGYDGTMSETISSLFYVVMSGTHAPLEMRLEAVKDFLSSHDLSTKRVGLRSLEAMMKTNSFSSHFDFEFGARSRDYGLYPKGGDRRVWFDSVLELTEQLVARGGELGEGAQKALAKKFRGLWTNMRCFDALERIARSIASVTFWRDGWLAARETIRYDRKALNPSDLQRLLSLEEFLRPKNLANSIRGNILGDKTNFDFEGIDDEDEKRWEKATARAAATVENLGVDAANDEAAFAEVLPELVYGPGRFYGFGRGLARGAESRLRIWTQLVEQFRQTKNPNSSILNGFINGVHSIDAQEAASLLDHALGDPALSEWLPELQTAVPIDERGVQRLHRSLRLGQAPIRRYEALSYGGASGTISAPDFRDLMLAIAAKPEGILIAIDILSMRLHIDRDKKRETPPEILELGRKLLEDLRFDRTGNLDHDDYRLGVVASRCLVGAKGAPVARAVWRNLKNSIDHGGFYGGDDDDLLLAMCCAQPKAMLDELGSGSPEERQKSIDIIHGVMENRRNPLSAIPDETVLQWCEEDPYTRYPFAAATVLLFARPAENEPHEWQDIAKQLLQRAPDPASVLREITDRLWPTSFSGSFADKYRARIELLDQLDVGDNPNVRVAFDEARSALVAQMRKEERSEQDESRSQSGFE